MTRVDILGHSLDQFTAELDPRITVVSVSRGCSFPDMNGNVCTGYREGQIGTSVFHATVELELPELTWFDRQRDIPMCVENFVTPVQRYLKSTELGFSSVCDDSVYRNLHELAYKYRRPGDRVFVPVDIVYGCAVSLGDYIPKGTPGCTADRVQELLYNPYAELPVPKPLPAIHGNTEFHDSLRLIASYPFCPPRDVPLICSAMTLSTVVPSKLVGVLKERMTLDLTVDRIFGPYPSDFDDGGSFKCIMADPEGNRVTWFTGASTLEKQGLEEGKTYNVAATPVKHDSDDGMASTQVNRLTRTDLPKTKRTKSDSTRS